MRKTTSATKKPQRKTKGLHVRTKRAVRHAVVPHARNQYHPHLIRSYGIAVVLALVFVVQAGVLSANESTQTVLGQTKNVTIERLVEDTNRERTAYRLPPLHTDSRLDAAATLKARDMLADQYWSHIAPDGTTPWQWVEATGYDYQYAGENLGRGFRTSSGVVTAWMNSKEHRANILNKKYSNVGFAVVKGKLNQEDTNIIVALYATPKSVDSSAETAVLAASGSGTNFITRLGVGLQSMTPALLGSIALLSFVAVVAVAAHSMRHKLSTSTRRSWRRHHGLYKAVGMVSVVIVLVALYGGGQI